MTDRVYAAREVALVVFLAGTLLAGRSLAQCRSDADCKGARVCAGGTCLEPKAGAPVPGAPMPGPLVAPAPAPAAGALAPARPATELPAQMPPPPRDGTIPFALGITFVAIGGLNLVTSPICLTGAVGRDVREPCLIASLAIGGACTAAGIPLTVVGARQRRRYAAWKRAVAEPRAFEGLRLSLLPGGGGLFWRSSF